ncbi:MAG TPA: thiol:disulfide interchange protein DsbA/DsbL [Moraxellaceae bacterium]|nr:thiol:disulfide interchange protein DsbA/DsbL [Moraxellaceae bacterium]
MFKRLFASFLLSLAAVTAFAAEPAYRTLATPGRVDKPGLIEVREFFWYGCPHCYKLEPHMAAWLKTKPADVNFVRTPAALNPVWEVNARGYYTVELMGMLEKTHGALFDAIHRGGKRPYDPDSLAAFYTAFGVNPSTFKSTYNSFAVDGKVSQSRALAQFYGLDGVPAVVVNGKYVVKGEGPEVIATINALIARERAAARKK